jgi:cytochrome c oxidase assembly protein subunit 15
VLALSTFALIAILWSAARGAELPRRARAGSNALLATAALQVLLGILTVVMAVPTALAVGHQANALLLLTAALYLLHALRRG